MVVMCVICFSSNANINITKLKTKEKCYKEIFSFCLDLKVTENLKTQNLCADCYSKLLSFDEFKTLALKNYAYLNATSPKCSVTLLRLQDNDCKDEIDPIDDGDNDISEINNETEIKIELNIKEEDLTECTLDGREEDLTEYALVTKTECPEEYLDDGGLDTNRIYNDYETVLQNLVSEDKLDCELSASAKAVGSRNRNHKVKVDKYKDIQGPKEICRQCGKHEWDITGHLLTHIPKSERSRSECDYCNKTYAKKQVLRKHIEWVHMGKQLEKSICNICDREVVNLKKHIVRTHNRDSQLQCNSCRKWFVTEKGLQQHKINSCPDNEKKKCQTCGLAVFNMKVHLLTHLPESEKYRYMCTVCSKGYTCNFSLRKHIKRTHGPVASKLETCDICSKGFRDLEGHKSRIHFTEKLSFKCPECPLRFPTEERLKIHSRVKCGRTECDICHKILGTYNTMLNHKKYVHAKVAKYLCQICSKRFVRKQNLKVHLRAHTNERPYKCETCGKGFNTTTSLSVHKDTHTAERKYQCNMCGKKYLSKIHLSRHIATHTSEKKHPCQYCGRLFLRSDQRRAHERNIHEKRGEMTLAECGKTDR